MSASLRNARLIVLVAWAAFLAWLQLAGQVPRYLGARTAWIVPVGAVVLAAAAYGYARWSREASAQSRRLTARDAMRLGVVLAPAAVALCLSDATLGSLAASKKLSGRGVDFSRLADSLADGSRPVDFLAIRVADEDPTAARRRAIVPGRPVTVLGVVLREPSAGGPVRLGRFYITCCVADSVVMDVAVYPRPGQRPARKDAWLRATGVLDRRRGHLVIAEARIAPVPRPAHPYLPFNL